ncbi:MAG: sialate O-acetylesterase [Firmicutes bacterium]|nr:sialate O-acetylesterase [Bacillota bacterium]
MVLDHVGPEDGRVLSFLMVGQSNMAGRGDIADVEPIHNPLCKVLRMGYWQRMDPPVNFDRDSAGISLAESFADDLATHTGRYIGLIPCAYGGTTIRRWMPGEILYQNAVAMAKIAMQSSDFGGIIWHQGENNCMGLENEKYRADLITVLTSLRKELGAEDLPLIIGEISEKITEEWNVGDVPKQMNALLRDVASTLPHCAIASSEGLTLRPDGIHFDAPSCRELGHRYFKKYIEITEESK